jgi:hypothetical protein
LTVQDSIYTANKRSKLASEWADIFNLFPHSFQQARIVKASASHRCSVNNKTIVF